VKLYFEDMVKYVVDVERRVIAIGGELQADAEQILMEDGSRQQDVWGANYYPGAGAAQCIEFAMIREHNVSRLANDQTPLGFDSSLLNPLNFSHERDRINHHTISNRTLHLGMKNSRGNQMKDKFFITDFDGVARIISTLGADNDVSFLRHRIDDLALTFIAPLCSN
jgi:hypothetical protein